MATVTSPDPATLPSVASPPVGMTEIQAKLDLRFEKETQALFAARLLTSARLVALLLFCVLGIDLIISVLASGEVPLGFLLSSHAGAAVLMLVLASALGRGGRTIGLTADLALYVPPAVALAASVVVTCDIEIPFRGVFFGAYLALIAGRTALVPGPRAGHLPTLAVLVALYPAIVCAGFAGGYGAFGVTVFEVGGSLLTQTFLLALMGGIGLLASDMTHAMHERIISARSMGRYKIQKELGRGAMGVVYLAWHRDLGRPCVIKFVHPEKDRTGALRHRFEREARETSLLRSPYTVQVFDFGVTQKGELYYVMEHLEGESLQDRLAEGGAQPFDLVCRWLSFACESLAEAHARGLIHRDVKPANLFLARTADGRETVKVLDFGIARKEPSEPPEIVLRQAGEPSTPESADLTAVGTVMGTPLYVAPEVLAGRSASAQADLYSLAATGFHLLTGRPLFTGKTIEELLKRTIRDRPVAPSTHAAGAGIPKALDGVFLRALAKKPADRHSSMEAFRLALEPFAAAAGSTHSTIPRN